MTNEEIIQEAIKRYPPGTRFIPVHVRKSAYSINTIPNINDYVVDIDNANVYIILKIKNSGLVLRDDVSGYYHVLGSISLDRRVTWAEIIEKPAEKPKCYDI